MADSKDTGTGGINLEGKVYTYDVGVPDNQVVLRVHGHRVT